MSHRPASRGPSIDRSSALLGTLVLWALLVGGCPGRRPGLTPTGDGGHTTPPECGVPRNPACSQGLNEQECWANDGAWECSYFDPSNCWCGCLTGDEGCLCWDSSHCQGHCVDFDMWGEDCQTLEHGACSDRVTLPSSCFCIFYGGEATWMCVE